jgi:indole-3-glycerol phosphate synthase
VAVTESGVSRPEDVETLKKANVNAYLVGGAFMAARDPGEELARLFGGR